MNLNILGIRGIPAAHGGFESFAARLAPYLRDQGHAVLVYCQSDEPLGGQRSWEDEWEGIHRVHYAPRRKGALGTMEFDAACVRDVVERPGIDLVLGYNTAVFNILQRLKGRRVLMNMDGIEWKRAKWSMPARAWFFINEIVGANLCHVPIADHPEIARHVGRRSFKQPVVIPYGSDLIESASIEPVTALGLEPERYLISIARIEPENSILEMVRAFESITTDAKLIVLGKFDPENAYHRKIRSFASDRIKFPGAIYDPETVSALRFHARAYLHGHQVGGTNPSLVEALGAGNACIAHDNRFNRWVGGPDQFYFQDEFSAFKAMDEALNNDARIAWARVSSRKRHAEDFGWDSIFKAYEAVLLDQAAKI